MPRLLKKDEAGSKPAGLLTQMVQIGRGNEEGSPGVRRARAVGTRELLHASRCGVGQDCQVALVSKRFFGF